MLRRGLWVRFDAYDQRRLDEELLLDWLWLELCGLAKAFARRLSRQTSRARRGLLQLPPRLIAASLVEGDEIRLRGRLSLTAGVATDHDRGARALEQFVQDGADLPDFSLVLDDGVTVANATEAAAQAGKLVVLDLWEDPQTHATCDSRTPALFRRSRFRAGAAVEVRGTAARLVSLDEPGAYRGAGVGWALVPADKPLAILFASSGNR
jgi:hypothetical protein